MHLEIWSIAGVLSEDHVQPSVFGVSGFGRVHVDAEDEGQLLRDDLRVGGTQLKRIFISEVQTMDLIKEE